MNRKDVNLARKYQELKEQEKALAAELEATKGLLRSALSANGEPLPNEGGFFFEASDGTVFSLVQYDKHTLKPDAVEILRRNLSDKDFKYLVETVEVIRTDRLELVAEKLVRGNETTVRGLSLRRLKSLYSKQQIQSLKISKANDKDTRKRG
jgi:hypothetical protein